MKKKIRAYFSELFSGSYNALTGIIGLLIVLIAIKFNSSVNQFIQYLIYCNLLCLIIEFGTNDFLINLKKTKIPKSSFLKELNKVFLIKIFLFVIFLIIGYNLFSSIKNNLLPSIIYLLGSVFNFQAYSIANGNLFAFKKTFFLIKTSHLIIVFLICYFLDSKFLIIIHSIFYLISFLPSFFSLKFVPKFNLIFLKKIDYKSIITFGFVRVGVTSALTSGSIIVDNFLNKELLQQFFVMDKIRINFQGIVSSIFSKYRVYKFKIHSFNIPLLILFTFSLAFIFTSYCLNLFYNWNFEITSLLVLFFLLPLILSGFNTLITNSILFHKKKALKSYFKIVFIQISFYLISIYFLINYLKFNGLLISILIFELTYTLSTIYAVKSKNICHFLKPKVKIF